jgi:bacterioferritin (cytochrome b1)
METSERELSRLNFYRSSALELGIGLAGLVGQVRDPWVIYQLTRHSQEELVHARLWTETILSLCGRPRATHRSYRQRQVLRLGEVRSTLQTLALVQVQEATMVPHLQEHAELETTHPIVRRALLEVLPSEKEHVAWVRWWLDREVESRGAEVEHLLERYREIDGEIYGEIRRELGFDPGVETEASTATPGGG